MLRAPDYLRTPEPPSAGVGLGEKREEGRARRKEGGGREEGGMNHFFIFLILSFYLTVCVYISFSMFTPVSCLFLIFFYGSLKI